eukprot:CAMPEP_0197040796 /NCGR_PEP_ID=MMETSP1384-20130603/17450_1 /TAXON_ID=29189 /ORGANISM="Ammonia sp." /LENGTH=116 /DNA_ID=CAMNT_0042471619 /DNA_START=92 /DNA_END=438 /DNA_ORIENTATION=+
MVAFCSITLSKGNHVISAGIRNGGINGEISSNGNSIIVKLYEPQIIDYSWTDVDIDDTSSLFDEDADYRVQVFGKQWVFPISVSERQLFIMFIDAENEEYEQGIIKAFDKRSVCQG